MGGLEPLGLRAWTQWIWGARTHWTHWIWGSRTHWIWGA